MTPLTIRLNRRIIVTLCIGLCWLLFSRTTSPSSGAAGIGSPLPPLALADRTGTPVETQQLVGQPTILTIWASWCPTCRAAMPFWERNAVRFRNDGLQVVAVNHREDVATLQAASAGFPSALTVWSDRNGQLLTALQSTDLPTTAFLDRHGTVVAVVRGPVSQTAAAVLISQITTP